MYKYNGEKLASVTVQRNDGNGFRTAANVKWKGLRSLPVFIYDVHKNSIHFYTIIPIKQLRMYSKK